MRLKDIVIGKVYKNTVYVKPMEIIRTGGRKNFLGETIIRCLISNSKNGKYCVIQDFYVENIYEETKTNILDKQ